MVSAGKKGLSAEGAVSGIKDLILQRGLHPGDLMPTEAELVEELGISRSSVREAVRTLVALDILEVRHGFGTFVGQLSMRPFVEAMVFRCMLQPGTNYELLCHVIELRRGLDLEMASHVVGNIPAETVTELDRLVTAMQVAAEKQEPFAAEDRAFHMALATVIPNAIYPQLVAAFWDIHSRMAPRLGKGYQRELTDTAEAHKAVLDAAVSGDADQFQRAIHRHYAFILSAIGAANPVKEEN